MTVISTELRSNERMGDVVGWEMIVVSHSDNTVTHQVSIRIHLYSLIYSLVQFDGLMIREHVQVEPEEQPSTNRIQHRVPNADKH